MSEDSARSLNAWTSIALLVALAGPPLFAAGSDRLFGESPSIGVGVALQVLYCGLAGFVVWVVLYKERLPLQSIGLRRPEWSTFVSGLLLWLGSLLLPLISAPLLNALGSEGVDSGMQRLATIPIWFRVILGVTGGIVEESLYRGYAIERLTTINRPSVAGWRDFGDRVRLRPRARVGARVRTGGRSPGWRRADALLSLAPRPHRQYDRA